MCVHVWEDWASKHSLTRKTRTNLPSQFSFIFLNFALKLDSVCGFLHLYESFLQICFCLCMCVKGGVRATDWVSWLQLLFTHTSSRVTWHQSNSVTTSPGESWQQQTRANLDDTHTNLLAFTYLFIWLLQKKALDVVCAVNQLCARKDAIWPPSSPQCEKTAVD